MEEEDLIMGGVTMGVVVLLVDMEDMAIVTMEEDIMDDLTMAVPSFQSQSITDQTIDRFLYSVMTMTWFMDGDIEFTEGVTCMACAIIEMSH